MMRPYCGLLFLMSMQRHWIKICASAPLLGAPDRSPSVGSASSSAPAFRRSAASIPAECSPRPLRPASPAPAFPTAPQGLASPLPRPPRWSQRARRDGCSRRRRAARYRRSGTSCGGPSRRSVRTPARNLRLTPPPLRPHSIARRKNGFAFSVSKEYR